jgi:predicted class III extradiol MEMO1 family dioxygenase
LAAGPDETDPDFMLVWDRLHLTHQSQRLSIREFTWLELLDGQRTLREIQAEAMRQADGLLLPLDLFTALVQKLDSALFLEGPEFRKQLAQPIREPSCLGCYEEDPHALRRQLRALFTGPRGPGLPRKQRPDGALRAALIPHIDYHRGGTTYAWGFKEVVERADARLFVIIGTSHYSAHRFTLTRKDFKTPLGIVPTDQATIDRLVAHYGDGLFDDELAHLPEHSIELEVVFLQYLYAGPETGTGPLKSRVLSPFPDADRPIRIVPLLVGPFHDCIEHGESPSEAADIRRMIEALKRVEAESQEPICTIISGDLAHIGPKFGDPEPVAPRQLDHSRRQDQILIQKLEQGDVAGYFRNIAAEGDCRRICGLPPTYTLLEAVRPGHGKLLDYDQYAHPRGLESVSFASMAFYR